MDPARAQMEAQTRQATVSMPLSNFLRCYDFSSPIRDEDWASKMVATPASPTVAPGQRARREELPRYIVYLPNLAEQQVTAFRAFVHQHLDPNVGANPDIVLAHKVWSEAVDFAEIPLGYAKQLLRTNGTSGCKSVALVPPSLDPLLRADARTGATSFAASQPVFGLDVHGEQVTYRTRVDFELRKGELVVAVLEARSPEASRSNLPNQPGVFLEFERALASSPVQTLPGLVGKTGDSVRTLVIKMCVSLFVRGAHHGVFFDYASFIYVRPLPCHENGRFDLLVSRLHAIGHAPVSFPLLLTSFYYDVATDSALRQQVSRELCTRAADLPDVEEGVLRKSSHSAGDSDDASQTALQAITAANTIWLFFPDGAEINTFGKLASPFVGLTQPEITSSLPPSALFLDDVLGSGSTAFAYTHLPAGRDTPDVVVKIPRTSELQEALVRSAQILQDLSGSGLAVELVAALYSKEGTYKFAMIEEYGGATLANWTDLNNDERMQIFLLAARLHTEFGIEHGDLRPENVVFTSDSSGKRRFRLIDFGHALTGHLCQVEADGCSELECLVKELDLEDDAASDAS